MRCYFLKWKTFVIDMAIICTVFVTERLCFIHKVKRSKCRLNYRVWISWLCGVGSSVVFLLHTFQMCDGFSLWMKISSLSDYGRYLPQKKLILFFNVADLSGSTPAGSHLEEKARLHVSSTCPSVWGASVALAGVGVYSIMIVCIGGGCIMTPPSSMIRIDCLFHHLFQGNGGLCVCVKTELSWNFEGRIGEKTRLGCPRPDFITSCFFTRSVPVFSLRARQEGRRRG